MAKKRERPIDWSELRRLTPTDRAEPWLLTIPVKSEKEFCGCVGQQQRFWAIGKGPREAFNTGQSVRQCLRCGATCDIWDYYGHRPVFTPLGGGPQKP